MSPANSPTTVTFPASGPLSPISSKSSVRSFSVERPRSPTAMYSAFDFVPPKKPKPLARPASKKKDPPAPTAAPKSHPTTSNTTSTSQPPGRHRFFGNKLSKNHSPSAEPLLRAETEPRKAPTIQVPIIQAPIIQAPILPAKSKVPSPIPQQQQQAPELLQPDQRHPHLLHRHHHPSTPELGPSSDAHKRSKTMDKLTRTLSDAAPARSTEGTTELTPPHPPLPPPLKQPSLSSSSSSSPSSPVIAPAGDGKEKEVGAKDGKRRMPRRASVAVSSFSSPIANLTAAVLRPSTASPSTSNNNNNHDEQQSPPSLHITPPGLDGVQERRRERKESGSQLSRSRSRHREPVAANGSSGASGSGAGTPYYHFQQHREVNVAPPTTGFLNANESAPGPHSRRSELPFHDYVKEAGKPTTRVEREENGSSAGGTTGGQQGGISTVVREENGQGWRGEWNQSDMKDVINKLRMLK